MKTAFLFVFAAWLIALVIFLVWVIGQVIHRSEPDPEEEQALEGEIHYYDNPPTSPRIIDEPYSKRLHDFNDSCDFEPK